MYQTWAKLLFLHWPLPSEQIRPLIPAGLELDTFEGRAWITVVPFTMWGIRPVFLPALPSLSASHELNVRTYVHLDGVPGVWFLSLDASNPFLVRGARWTYSLPYFRARMRLAETGRTIDYHSRRKDPSTPVAEFEASWTLGKPLLPTKPDSLEFFLVDRYWLYAENGGQLYRARIHHPPWPLHQGTLLHLKSTMIETHGLPTPQGPPLLQAQGEPLRVEVWPLKRI
jgi:uncharacterized protein YqjF (DUF2071 family)